MLQELDRSKIHMIGIKGTGMSSLAVALTTYGAQVTGSDIPQRFFTDRIIEDAGITVAQEFSEENIPKHCDLVIASPAYTAENNEELSYALHRGIPVKTYVEMLSMLSQEFYTCAVAGTHGKSSTSAMLDHLLGEESISHLSIYGTALQGRKDRQVLEGMKLLCIEACEYREHFLEYSPDMIILTSISHDHPDYFKDLKAVHEAFVLFVLRLPDNGVLIYNSDDPEVVKVIDEVLGQRDDLKAVPYGFSAVGEFQIMDLRVQRGSLSAGISAKRFTLHIPGRHMIEDMTGAVIAVRLFSKRPLQEILIHTTSYPGCIRRSELIGMYQNICFVDDYGHHPQEISKTLTALREYYEPKRMIVDFIPHTISRTKALYDDFVESFDSADIVIIHPVYMTVRETVSEPDAAGDWGRRLADAIPGGIFIDESIDRLATIGTLLQDGDLFITMGAGNNRETGEHLLEALKNR